MRNIYKGKLRNMTVKNVEINNGTVSSVLYQNTVIKEDILFYSGIMGAYISFDYGTRLPDYGEAQDIISYSIERSENPEDKTFQCSYVDYNEMKLDRIVTDQEFRQMKKEYKEARKRK